MYEKGDQEVPPFTKEKKEEKQKGGVRSEAGLTSSTPLSSTGLGTGEFPEERRGQGGEVEQSAM